MNSDTPGDRPLTGRTLLMSGGSRGIGLAIATAAAKAGADIAFIAKTDTPDPRLPGTVHTAAAAIEEAGGRAPLAIVGDIRDEESIDRAVAATVDRFGGIDIVVNNASAISVDGYGALSLKRFDLMADINVRGTFALMSKSLPYLKMSPDPRVLSLSPPLNLDPIWLKEHAPYTASKYAMTILTLGMAEQFREEGMSASCLWPKTFISTAAVENILTPGGKSTARRPGIMADAAMSVFTSDAEESNGRCFLDEEVLRSAGMTDFSAYLNPGGTESDLQPDLFV
ncbi:SDR family oxidoreductase [Rhodococcus qingshengii]|uniref:SDR family oxidoreductase n=1 Tax=Rhodococcus qingshengii TaxID=334542 RepID=UPI0036DED1C5